MNSNEFNLENEMFLLGLLSDRDTLLPKWGKLSVYIVYIQYSAFCS